MANFEGRTACYGGKIKDLDGFHKLMEIYHWSWDGFVGLSKNNEFEVYGYDWPYVNKMMWDEDYIDAEPIPDDEDHFDEFLEDLAPLLETPFILQAIGGEKCRFPLSGMQVTVYPNGNIEWDTLPGYGYVA